MLDNAGRRNNGRAFGQMLIFGGSQGSNHLGTKKEMSTPDMMLGEVIRQRNKILPHNAGRCDLLPSPVRYRYARLINSCLYVSAHCQTTTDLQDVIDSRRILRIAKSPQVELILRQG